MQKPSLSMTSVNEEGNGGSCHKPQTTTEILVKAEKVSPCICLLLPDLVCRHTQALLIFAWCRHRHRPLSIPFGFWSITVCFSRTSTLAFQYLIPHICKPRQTSAPLVRASSSSPVSHEYGIPCCRGNHSGCFRRSVTLFPLSAGPLRMLLILPHQRRHCRKDF
jgi:hypothetical protein